MEFTAEFGPADLQRYGRKRNLIGILIIVALLAVFAPLIPAMMSFAESVITAIQKVSAAPTLDNWTTMLVPALLLAGFVLLLTAGWLAWSVIKNLVRSVRITFLSNSPDVVEGLVDGVQYGTTQIRFLDDAVEMKRRLLHNSTQWSAFVSASLRGDLLSLTMQNGSFYLIPAEAAPGGSGAALEFARGAIDRAARVDA